MDTAIIVTLVVKGDANRAAQEVTARLNQWFLEDTDGPAPYPAGALLYWRQRRADEESASHEAGSVYR